MKGKNMYEVNKRKLPRKKDDPHNLYCVYRAIRDYFSINASFLQVSQEKYISYYKILIDKGLIVKNTKKTKYCPEAFTVKEEYKTSNAFTKALEKVIYNVSKGVTSAYLTKSNGN